VWTDDPTYISKILPDGNGGLWIGTRNGLYHYTIATKTYKKYVHDEQDPASISDDRIFDVMLDGHYRLWVSTSRGGLNLYQPESDGFRSFSHNPNDPTSISSNFLRKLAETRDGRIWVESDEGVGTTFYFTLRRGSAS